MLSKFPLLMVLGFLILLFLQRWVHERHPPELSTHPLAATSGNQYELQGGSDAVQIQRQQATGPASALLNDADEEGLSDTEVAQRRADKVLEAARHTWQAYETYAWGFDEIKPISLEGSDSFGGLGVTIVDSLDTLWMLGMHEEYERAVDWVVQNLTYDKPETSISLFETNIRVVGGLLSASQLTNDSRLLDKAADLAARFLPAFDTDTGIPYNWQRMSESAPRRTDVVQIADAGTFTLEFATLTADLSSGKLPNPSRQLPSADAYAAAAEGAVRAMMSAWPRSGLIPSQVFQLKPETPPPGMQHMFSVGGASDSYYEYLLKLWILKGKGSELEPYRAAWERSADEALDKLYFTLPPHELHRAGLDKLGLDPELEGAGFLGVQHADVHEAVGRQEHLACYFPGNLILGLMHGAVPEAKRVRYESAAANLTVGCWAMYGGSYTGLSPEAQQYHIHSNRMLPVAMHNMLRPEAVESIFHMWRYTHDPKWRAMGWNIFKAFEANSKVTGGYTGLTNVALPGPADPDDATPSFWMAETIKYFWLLFSPDDALDLKSWVLNTEAHPLHVLAAASVA